MFFLFHVLVFLSVLLFISACEENSNKVENKNMPYGEKEDNSVNHYHDGIMHSHRLRKEGNGKHRHKGTIIYKNCIADTINLNYKYRCPDINAIIEKKDMISTKTISLTKNSNFKNGLTNWHVNNEIYVPAQSSINISKTEESVELILKSNSSDVQPNSIVDIFQKHFINEDINNYYLSFYLDQVIGTANGNPILACVQNGGFSGIYVSFKDALENQIGLVTWSDHCNKFDLAWGGVSNGIYSNDTYYNERFRPVIRRVTPKDSEDFDYLINLGDLISEKLPKLEKSKIKYIEYGAFATERRGYSGCYYCESIIEIYKINLLKKVSE